MHSRAWKTQTNRNLESKMSPNMSRNSLVLQRLGTKPAPATHSALSPVYSPSSCLHEAHTQQRTHYLPWDQAAEHCLGIHTSSDRDVYMKLLVYVFMALCVRRSHDVFCGRKVFHRRLLFVFHRRYSFLPLSSGIPLHSQTSHLPRSSGRLLLPDGCWIYKRSSARLPSWAGFVLRK